MRVFNRAEKSNLVTEHIYEVWNSYVIYIMQNTPRAVQKSNSLGFKMCCYLQCAQAEHFL